MAGNAIALIQKYATKAWDEVYVAESRSAVLDGEKDFLKFTGTKTVKVAEYMGAGLKNYGRANTPISGDYAEGSATPFSSGDGYGYPVGDIALAWEEFTLSVDRAIQLRIELMDDEETDGLAVAMALKETNRVSVVPESYKDKASESEVNFPPTSLSWFAITFSSPQTNTYESVGLLLSFSKYAK